LFGIGEHGQGVPVPSPKQNGVAGVAQAAPVSLTLNWPMITPPGKFP
jgi:hypothetical protein